MFFRKWISKGFRNNLVFNSREIDLLVLNSLSREIILPVEDRVYFSVIKTGKSFSYLSYFRRHCIVSGYPKSVFRFFKLSRHNCKLFSSLGLLNGMRKSSF